jgi:hypothetical protein
VAAVSSEEGVTVAAVYTSSQVFTPIAETIGGKLVGGLLGALGSTAKNVLDVAVYAGAALGCDAVAATTGLP